MYYIYQLQNKVNGKRYIGYTTQQPNARWTDHKYYAKNSIRKSKFYSAIKKYGASQFTLSILCEGQNHQAGLKIAEPLMMALFKPEYNMTKGGDGLIDPSPEIRKKLRESAIRRGLGQNQTGEKNPMFGKRFTLSPEAREKIRISAIGRKHTDETKRKLSIALHGNKNRLGKMVK